MGNRTPPPRPPPLAPPPLPIRGRAVGRPRVLVPPLICGTGGVPPPGGGPARSRSRKQKQRKQRKQRKQTRKQKQQKN